MRRAIFVDFDDTLFIWDHRISHADAHLAHLRGSLNYDIHGQLNLPLIQVLEKEKVAGSKIFLLTAVDCSCELASKIKYLSKKCPELFNDFFSVSSTPYKATFMAEYATVHNIPKVCLIDDRHDALMAVKARGFDYRTPTEVMTFGGVWGE